MLSLPFEKYQGLLFDLDGTLADSMPLHHEAWIVTYKSLGFNLTESILQEYAGVPTERTVAILNQRFGWKLDPLRVAEQKEKYAQDQMSSVKIIEPVASLARNYFGKKPMAIVSGGTRDSVALTLRAIGLDNIFSLRVCAGDTLRGKPAPDPFLKAAELLHLPADQCLVFEDGHAGIEGARLAGMGVVKVTQDKRLEFLTDGF